MVPQLIFKKKALPHLFKKVITDQHLSKHVQATRVTISNLGRIINRLHKLYTSFEGGGGGQIDPKVGNQFLFVDTKSASNLSILGLF
jgi:hypothetical protein